MGNNISGMCGGREPQGKGEVLLSVHEHYNEEPSKAKSAIKLQSKWKRIKISQLKKMEAIKLELDEKSQMENEFVTVDFMNTKISPFVIQMEKDKLKPFDKDSKIKGIQWSFDRRPILLKDGSIYHGQWNLEGQKHGYGILVRNDGSKYEGFFLKDAINSNGRYIEAQGTFYYEGILRFNLGLWKDNKAHNKGSYYLSDGTKYTGDWKDDIQEGEGEEISPDGTVYTGQFKEGEKNGKGLVKWTNGSSFEGDFVNNSIHGNGVYMWSDGRVYKGQWMNGKMHGKGYFIWQDGKYYDGDYKNDKKDGFGKYFWNGKFYEGTWFNGKQNGYGAVYVNNELILKGIWRYGKIIKKDFEKKDNFDSLSIATNDNNTVKSLFGNGNHNTESVVAGTNNYVGSELKDSYKSNENCKNKNDDKTNAINENENENTINHNVAPRN